MLFCISAEHELVELMKQNLPSWLYRLLALGVLDYIFLNLPKCILCS